MSDPAAEAATPPAEPLTTLDLTLAPEDLPALIRLGLLDRAEPSRPAVLHWFDDAEGSLARAGTSLVRERGAWHLHALDGPGMASWAACSPPPLLDTAGSAAALRPAPPFDVAPVAAFEGRRRSYLRGPVGCDALHGTVRGVAAARDLCRLRLSGPAEPVAEAALALERLRVAVPRGSLAAEAHAAARDQAMPARHLGAPEVPAGTSVGDGLAAITSHLLDALLHWVDEYRRDGRAEAVHQARVATRRLRSAFTLYRRAVPAPELAEAAEALKGCATQLGGARDWDVFLHGTGRTLGAAGDRRMDALLRAATRRRAAAHRALADYLASAEFRRLELRLGLAAALRRWEGAADPAQRAAPTAGYAAEVLARRYRRVRRRARALESLPVAELHELRKDCKRLRYAAEFFAPAFPGKRSRAFLKRLSALQEELGALNDSAVAGALMAQLGRAGAGYAAGVVAGMAGAAVGPARDRIAGRWRRFRQADPFWTV